MSHSPFISGFSIIKNGISLGYPFIESLKSLEPLCDEIVVGVGFDDQECLKDDGTWELLHKTFPSSKFHFFKSYWDPAISSQGLILSQQTNLALKKCRGVFCQYLQSDEILHENEIQPIKELAKEFQENKEVESFVFNYIHFYGNPSTYKYTRNVYRREVRLIRKDANLQSYLDAQGFRHQDGSKPKALLTPFHIYHYGWAREQELMDKKNKAFSKFYHGQSHQSDDFTYKKEWGLKSFQGTHPKEALNWVNKQNQSLDISSLSFKWDLNILGLMISDFIEWLCGHRIGEFKNYKLLKRKKYDTTN